MPKQETVSLTPELEAFQRQVDEFVYNQIQNQKQLLQEGRRGHFYINDLIANTPLVSSDILKNIINKEQEKQFSKQDLDEVKKSFNFMRERLNGFPAKKRFYILETMDLFSSQVNIGKLIPALLLLDGNDLKKAVCEFIKPSFTSINKNIETLVSTTKLFSPKTMHIDMGSLYSFSGELASVLLRLFKPSFLNQFNDISSSIELLLTVIQAGSPCHSPTQKKPVYLEMLDDKNKIRRIILEFIVKMQSHDALLTYAFKRNGYYKHFLASVTNPDRFKGIEPLYISRIFAGCLVSNKQLMPEESLIDGMLDPELFNNPILLKQRIQFIDKLAPSTVNKLITDIRLHLQEFSKKSMAKEFHQVNSLSVITVLKKIWSGFVRFIDKNIETVVKPVKFAFEQIKTTYAQFLKEADEFDEYSQNNASDKSRKKKLPVIPKNQDSISIVHDNYQVVETDIISFRGEYDGASQKDIGYSARLFHQEELTIFRFHTTFEKLFISLASNPLVKAIHFQTQRNIKEYYAAFSFQDKLIAIGITHQKTSSSTIQEKDLFPYVILFSKSDEKVYGRVISREVQDQNGLALYNEESMTNNNAVYFYESLYHILHLLPDKDWSQSNCQMVIRFLIEELIKLKSRNIRPLFLNAFPE